MITGPEREGALRPGAGSPPYFPLGSGIEGEHPQKVACRFELRGDIADYTNIAGAHLAAGGVFTCVFPEDQRERVERAAAAAGLVIVRRRPVVFREGASPLITLFAMTPGHGPAAGDALADLGRAATGDPRRRRRRAPGVRRGQAGGRFSAVKPRRPRRTRSTQNHILVSVISSFVLFVVSPVTRAPRSRP